MILMSDVSKTCWTLIEAAAQGQTEERDLFARHYGPVVTSYLRARWRDPRLREEIDDAIQDVFMECFKCGGALERVENRRPGGFRAFLHGITRNVASRIEGRRARVAANPASSEAGVSQLPDADLDGVFDRAWALSTVRQAISLQADRCRDAESDSRRGVELLRLRFHDGLPIREIADRWNEDPANLHREYARARKEFKSVLREVVAFHLPQGLVEVDEECRHLLTLLQ